MAATGFTATCSRILPKLDPAITTIVSGHTHWAYVCNGTAETGAGRLMTSAGKNGYFVTDLRLTFDPATRAAFEAGGDERRRRKRRAWR